jgi:hypothetical protein
MITSRLMTLSRNIHDAARSAGDEQGFALEGGHLGTLQNGRGKDTCLDQAESDSLASRRYQENADCGCLQRQQQGYGNISEQR